MTSIISTISLLLLLRRSDALLRQFGFSEPLLRINSIIEGEVRHLSNSQIFPDTIYYCTIINMLMHEFLETNQ